VYSSTSYKIGVKVIDNLLNEVEYVTDTKETLVGCFTVTSNGVITDYLDSCDRKLVIPKKFNGITITEIGDEAFFNKGIKSLELHDGIKKIGNNAFYQNPFNETDKLEIPSSVEEIGTYAFANITDGTNKLNATIRSKYLGDTSINGDEEVDYVIDDDIYITATNLFSFGSSYDKYEGKVIKIRGFVQKNKDFITPGYFAIGKYAVTCCVADSSFIGVLVKEDKMEVVDEGWYEVVGKLYKIVDKYGYTSLALKPISINKIEKEDSLYVYPCYDGKCIDKLKKYGLNSFE